MAHVDRPGGAVTAGEYIRQLREARNMSIADLQRVLGVAWSTVNSWEKKGAVPDRTLTAAIVEKLGLTQEERIGLLEAVNRPPPSTPPHGPASPRSPGTPASPRVPSYGPRPALQRDAMSDALTRALDTSRHTLKDAILVLEALEDAGEVFLTLADPALAARAWLDAAALLRGKKLDVTAASLAVVLPEVLAGHRPP